MIKKFNEFVNEGEVRDLMTPKDVDGIVKDILDKMPKAEGDKKYTLIGKWTEKDGKEEWDVLLPKPVTREEAEQWKIKMSAEWNKNETELPEDRRLPHREIIMLWDDYIEMYIQSELKGDRFNESVNEGFKVTPDDYNYFRRQLLWGSEPNSELINSLIDNRNEYIQMLMSTARSHWELGDGKRNEFPEKEYFKVIDEVITEIINER